MVSLDVSVLLRPLLRVLLANCLTVIPCAATVHEAFDLSSWVENDKIELKNSNHAVSNIVVSLTVEPSFIIQPLIRYLTFKIVKRWLLKVFCRGVWLSAEREGSVCLSWWAAASSLVEFFICSCNKLLVKCKLSTCIWDWVTCLESRPC